jgi:hypothetical protein
LGTNEGLEKMNYKIHQNFGEIEMSDEIEATVYILEKDSELAFIQI